eukprot:g2758.t1
MINTATAGNDVMTKSTNMRKVKTASEMSTSAPDYASGFQELTNIVERTLEVKGVLASLKAQMRAAVFSAIDEQRAINSSKKVGGESTERRDSRENVVDSAERHKPLPSRTSGSKLEQSGPEGRIVAQLFIDFLKFYGLGSTLSVFEPECHGILNRLKPEEEEEEEEGSLKALLRREMPNIDIPNTESSKKSDHPLIFQLLHSLPSHSKDRHEQTSSGMTVNKKASAVTSSKTRTTRSPQKPGTLHHPTKKHSPKTNRSSPTAASSIAISSSSPSPSTNTKQLSSSASITSPSNSSRSNASPGGQHRKLEPLNNTPPLPNPNLNVSSTGKSKSQLEKKTLSLSVGKTTTSPLKVTVKSPLNSPLGASDSSADYDLEFEDDIDDEEIELEIEEESLVLDASTGSLGGSLSQSYNSDTVHSKEGRTLGRVTSTKQLDGVGQLESTGTMKNSHSAPSIIDDSTPGLSMSASQTALMGGGKKLNNKSGTGTRQNQSHDNSGSMSLEMSIELDRSVSQHALEKHDFVEVIEKPSKRSGGKRTKKKKKKKKEKGLSRATSKTSLH